MQHLVVAHANYAAAHQALEHLGEKRRAAIVKAVEAGNMKTTVARAAGVTPARVSAICEQSTTAE